VLPLSQSAQNDDDDGIPVIVFQNAEFIFKFRLNSDVCGILEDLAVSGILK
jgi:hypothetical protein